METILKSHVMPHPLVIEYVGYGLKAAKELKYPSRNFHMSDW